MIFIGDFVVKLIYHMELSLEVLTNVFQESFAFYWTYLKDQLMHPAWNNYYYWVIFWMLFSVSLELLLPKKYDYKMFGRKGFWLDVFYVLFNDFLLMGLGFFSMLVIVEIVYKYALSLIGIVPVALLNIGDWPMILQILFVFILQDFLEFFAHYLLHRVEFLWAFHKIHHATEELNSVSTRRFHWAEYLVFKPILYLPFSIIGYSIPQYFLIAMTIGIFSSFFTHCNIKTNFGFFNYIINNPETHHWHHAKNIPNKYGVNYASVLNFWDVLFGTYYVPKGEIPELGLPDSKEMPTGFFGQQLYPLRYIFGKKKISQMELETVAEVSTNVKSSKKEKS